MKRLNAAAIFLSLAFGMSSCTTAYDAYGRPVQVVDPAAAAVGAVAIGAAAYAIGKHNSDDKRGHRNYGNRCQGGCHAGCPHHRGHGGGHGGYGSGPRGYHR